MSKTSKHSQGCPWGGQKLSADLRLKIGLGWGDFQGLTVTTSLFRGSLLPPALPTQGQLDSWQGLFFSVLDFAQNTPSFWRLLIVALFAVGSTRFKWLLRAWNVAETEKCHRYKALGFQRHNAKMKKRNVPILKYGLQFEITGFMCVRVNSD